MSGILSGSLCGQAGKRCAHPLPAPIGACWHSHTGVRVRQGEKFWNSHEIVLYRAEYSQFTARKTEEHV